MPNTDMTFWGLISVLVWNVIVVSLGLGAIKLGQEARQPPPHAFTRHAVEFLAAIHVAFASYYVAMLRTLQLAPDLQSWAYVSVGLAITLTVIGTYQSIRIKYEIAKDHSERNPQQNAAVPDHCPDGCEKRFPFLGVWTRVLWVFFLFIVSIVISLVLTSLATATAAPKWGWEAQCHRIMYSLSSCSS